MGISLEVEQTQYIGSLNDSVKISNNIFYFRLKAQIFGGGVQLIRTTPVRNWYLIYRHQNDERQRRFRRNLNSERKDRRNIAKRFARRANVSYSFIAHKWLNIEGSDNERQRD